MTPMNVSRQLTLNFEPSLAERHRTLREFIAHRVHIHSRPAKVIAADMDMSPSLLTRKLHAGIDPEDRDTQRFNCDDLEDYLRCTGDVMAVMEYLISKFAPGGDEIRKSRALATVERLGTELSQALQALKSGGS